jgi:hypothetical protein
MSLKPQSEQTTNFRPEAQANNPESLAQPFSPVGTNDFKILRTVYNSGLAHSTRELSEGANALLPKMDVPESASMQFAANDRGAKVLSDAPSSLDALLKASQAREGQKIWARTPFARMVDDGLVGCAASLSKVLNEGGERVKPSPLAFGLKQNLKAAGRIERPFSEVAVGDVVYGTKTGRNAKKGGGASHIAPITGVENGRVTVSDNFGQAGGIWTKRPIEESFKPDRYDYSKLVVLKKRH